MKQYTTPEQTAKLIELGLPKPKSEVRSERGPFSSDARKAYSIGELIEILENAVKKDNFITDLDISCDEIAWLVRYISEGVGRFKTQMPTLSMLFILW